MKKLFSALVAVVLTASFALPLNAAPIHMPKAEQVQTGDIVQVKNRHHGRWRSDRDWNRRYAHRSCRYYGNCYRERYYGYPRYGYRDYYPYHRRSGVTVYFNF